MAPWYLKKSKTNLRSLSTRYQGGRVVWIILLCAFLGASLVVGTTFVYVSQTLETPLNPGESVYVIKRGQSLKSFLKDLKGKGVIEEIYSPMVYAYWKGLTTRVKAGQYQFKNGLNQIQLLDKIVAGSVLEYQLRFIEGWTFRQVIKHLSTSEHLKISLTGHSNKEIMSLLGKPNEHPEGRFFPDTYSFTLGESDIDILRRAYEAMQVILEQEWQKRSDEARVATPYEALILASIIEKETGLAEERTLISGVFTNRLNKKMRLQTDPTVIYGLGDSFNGNLKRKHLKADTEYNTYTRHGLPPTPIAMPGREAINAALQPEATKAIFFVSRGDGSHKFSETLEQHNDAVRKFQLRRKKKKS
ncbi:MAG: UPF0755 protein [Parasphingorhabdus sp.]|jgi:UPF0755 protein